MRTALLGILCVAMLGPVTAAEKTSRPLEYSGYGEPQYQAFRREAAYVPVGNGVSLAITLYIPTQRKTPGATAERFPSLLWYLPGHRESIDPKTGELRPAASAAELNFFTSNGYVYAIAEMRGSGASSGSRVVDRGPQIGIDGKAIVEWMAKQPWSTGKVGMVGLSYQGFSQYATAAQRPKGLKAIFPEIAGFDEYSIMFYPGGIMNVAMSAFASSNIQRDDQNIYIPGRAGPADGANPRSVLPSVPVIDEDGDGELRDEIPVDKNGNGSFLDDGPPTYADGKARKDVYFNATKQHLDNLNLTPELLAQAPYRDSKIPGTQFSYADLGPALRPQQIADSGIAVYNRAGWFDYHARCAVQWFATLAGHTPTRLLIGPTGHSGFPSATAPGGPYFQHFGVKETAANLYAEKLRFFDRYLKDIDNGFDREAPIYLYVMNAGWRAEQEWPLKRAVNRRFYLGAEHVLQPDAGSAAQDEYRVDFTTDSRYKGANRWNYGITGLKEPMRGTEQDRKRLTYTSAPLAQDMEVVGHPQIELLLGANAPDADVFVYLEDVDANDESLLVTDGQLRASFAKQRPIQAVVAKQARVMVAPALPWHGFERADAIDAPLANGAQQRLTIDLMPTAYRFPKGHRIRIAIAGADFPTFALHPKLAPGNDPAAAGLVPPILTVARGGKDGSFVQLPIVPAIER